jgi:two-component system nitrate/nitrite response regulator NarL
MHPAPTPDSPAIRILMVDDHEMFRAGIRALLRDEPGLTVVAEAGNKSEALEAARSQPDIILLDLDLADDNALEFLPALMHAAGDAHVLVVTGVPDPELHVRAVCLGAMGVVHKLEAPNQLLKAIRKVHGGEAWLSRSLVASAMKELHRVRQPAKAGPDETRIANLTSRELEVIRLIGEGRRNKTIGEQLFISEKTVRHYLTSIYGKLDVNDRLELMIFAYQHGLAQVPSLHPPATPVKN